MISEFLSRNCNTCSKGGYENSSFEIGAQFLGGLFKVNVVRRVVSRKQEAQDSRFPFSLKHVQLREYDEPIIRESCKFISNLARFVEKMQGQGFETS